MARQDLQIIREKCLHGEAVTESDIEQARNSLDRDDPFERLLAIQIVMLLGLPSELARAQAQLESLLDVPLFSRPDGEWLLSEALLYSIKRNSLPAGSVKWAKRVAAESESEAARSNASLILSMIAPQ